MDGWYYSRNGQSVGPMPLAQLKQLTAAGEVSPEDPVWHPSLAGWTSARKVPGLVPLRGARQTAAAAAQPMPAPVRPIAPVAPSAEPPVAANQAAAGTEMMDAPPVVAGPIDIKPVSQVAALNAYPVAAPHGEVHFRTAQILQRSRLWLWIIAVVCFLLAIAAIMSGATLLAGGSMLGQMMPRQGVPADAAGTLSAAVIVTGIAYVLFGALTALIGVQLVRSVLAIGDLLAVRRVSDLDKALAAQLIYWRLTAILTIAAVVMSILIVLVL